MVAEDNFTHLGVEERTYCPTDINNIPDLSISVQPKEFLKNLTAHDPDLNCHRNILLKWLLDYNMYIEWNYMNLFELVLLYYQVVTRKINVGKIFRHIFY